MRTRTTFTVSPQNFSLCTQCACQNSGLFILICFGNELSHEFDDLCRLTYTCLFTSSDKAIGDIASKLDASYLITVFFRYFSLATVCLYGLPLGIIIPPDFVDASGCQACDCCINDSSVSSSFSSKERINITLSKTLLICCLQNSLITITPNKILYHALFACLDFTLSENTRQ